MNSVGENAFLASRRASSCPLKGMFLNGGGCGPSPNLSSKGRRMPVATKIAMVLWV